MNRSSAALSSRQRRRITARRALTIPALTLTLLGLALAAGHFHVASWGASPPGGGVAQAKGDGVHLSGQLPHTNALFHVQRPVDGWPLGEDCLTSAEGEFGCDTVAEADQIVALVWAEPQSQDVAYAGWVEPHANGDGRNYDIHGWVDGYILTPSNRRIPSWLQSTLSLVALVVAGFGTRVALRNRKRLRDVNG